MREKDSVPQEVTGNHLIAFICVDLGSRWEKILFYFQMKWRDQRVDSLGKQFKRWIKTEYLTEKCISHQRSRPIGHPQSDLGTRGPLWWFLGKIINANENSTWYKCVTNRKSMVSWPSVDQVQIMTIKKSYKKKKLLKRHIYKS